MKELSLVKTNNVIEAEKMITYLLNRPLTEMVGLGLIYGQPGLGKSRFARQTAIRNDYIYLRLESTMTAKSFSIQLLQLVQRHFGYPSFMPARGAANDIFRKTVDLLKNQTNIVLVIDEIDYAFKSKKMLGAIRDIVDETLTVVILVGMTDAREKLLQADMHYFDRCNFFCEFKELNTDDIKLVCDEVSSVKVKPEIIRFLQSKTRGNIRKLVKSLYSIENMATNLNITEFGLEHLDKTTVA
ncbi:MAG: ATP-binding protein [Candidatus Cloacimonetes bacterium]|nr:ATP-binding protein [Candidatus Cloacimonadota bacterium]